MPPLDGEAFFIGLKLKLEEGRSSAVGIYLFFAG